MDASNIKLIVSRFRHEVIFGYNKGTLKNYVPLYAFIMRSSCC